MNQQLALWVMFVLVMTEPEIEGIETNDLELQTCDSQDDSEDDAQADCSEMIAQLWRWQRHTDQFYSMLHCNVTSEQYIN